MALWIEIWFFFLFQHQPNYGHEKKEKRIWDEKHETRRYVIPSIPFAKLHPQINYSAGGNEEGGGFMWFLGELFEKHRPNDSELNQMSEMFVLNKRRISFFWKFATLAAKNIHRDRKHNLLSQEKHESKSQL